MQNTFASLVSRDPMTYTLLTLFLLDIGEVDLIVNYDSLRSPIRMIQRVGRTGRKRDGRVVCLVSEGAEEKTMVQSKNAERTLGRALKKPDSFAVVRGSPMFPQAPVLRKVDMTEMKVFHMSQVGGNAAAKRSRDVTNMDDVGNEVNTAWRLKDTQELKRQSTFGDLSFFSCLELQSSDGRLPQALGKRLLRARTRSISTYENRHKPVPAAFGISRTILLKVERKHGKDVDKRVLFNNASSGRLRRESGALQQLFPLERSSATDSLDRGILKMSLSTDENSTELQDEALLASKPSNPVTSPLPQSKNECNQNITCMMPAPSCDIEMTGIAGTQNPYVAPTSGDDSHGRSKGLPQLLEDDAARENVPEAQPVNKGPTDCVQECPSVNSEFRLPTPPESSSSEGSSSETTTMMMFPLRGQRETNVLFRSQRCRLEPLPTRKEILASAMKTKRAKTCRCLLFNWMTPEKIARSAFPRKSLLLTTSLVMKTVMKNRNHPPSHLTTFLYLQERSTSTMQQFRARIQNLRLGPMRAKKTRSLHKSRNVESCLLSKKIALLLLKR